MSENNTKQPDKAPATPAKKSDELDAQDLEKVAGGMMANVLSPKKKSSLTGDPCEGGE